MKIISPMPTAAIAVISTAPAAISFTRPTIGCCPGCTTSASSSSAVLNASAASTTPDARKIRDHSTGEISKVIPQTPANTRIYRKTTKAKEFLERAKKASGREKVDLVRSGAGALRRTIEEVVVFHLFKDTVRRWNEQIRLGCVTKISWSDAVADEIVALQDDTSRLLEGHSNSDEFAGGMPGVDELEKLIARVDAVIEKAKLQRG